MNKATMPIGASFKRATSAQLQARAARQLSQARVDMLLTMRFHGALAMRLTMEPRGGQDTPLSTDGRTLWYDAAQIIEWSHSRTVAAMAQAVLHCAHGHPWRMGARDPERWGLACDLAVNHLLKADGFDIPDDWPIDAQYQGMSAEVIYSRLPQRDDKQDGDQQQQQQCGSGASGSPQSDDQGSDDADGQPGSDAAPSNDPAGVEKPQPQGEDDGASADELADQLEAEWTAAASHAAEQARQRGQTPASAQSAVGEMKRPKGDWRNELRHALQTLTNDDYSWRIPSARYLSRGLYLPRLHSERIGTVVFVRDTSGSVSDDTLAKANAEIAAAIDECKPQRFVIIDCDAKVQRTWDMEAGDDVPDLRIAHGRGGTSFRPPFDWLRAQEIEPAALIYLTDLEGDFPTPPDYPVLWVACTRHQAPFGKTLHIL